MYPRVSRGSPPPPYINPPLYDRGPSANEVELTNADASGESDNELNWEEEFRRRRAPSVDSLPPPEALLSNDYVRTSNHLPMVNQAEAPIPNHLHEASEQHRLGGEIPAGYFGFSDYNDCGDSEVHNLIGSPQSRSSDHPRSYARITNVNERSYEAGHWRDEVIAWQTQGYHSENYDGNRQSRAFDPLSGRRMNVEVTDPMDSHALNVKRIVNHRAENLHTSTISRNGIVDIDGDESEDATTVCVTTPTSPASAPPWHFELLLHLTKPDSGKPRKGAIKTQKEPEKRGPVNVSSTVDFDKFLRTCASIVPTSFTGLFTNTFEWHFLKPSTGPWLPITTEAGFQSMLGQAKQQTVKNLVPYIIVRMRKPVQGLVVDEIEDSDEDSDDHIGPIQKKGKIDDELDVIVQKLLNRYPPGRCNQHQDLSCFYHRPLNLHFELTRGRCLVWACDIRDNKPGVDYNQIPLASPLFHAKHTLKAQPTKSSEVPAASTALMAPLTPMHPGGFPVMHNGGYSPYGQYPMMSPMQPMQPMYPFGAGGYPLMHPSWPTPIPAASGSGRSIRFSPPRSSPPPGEGCTLHQFCTEYRLNEEIEAGLGHLGYEPGASLLGLSSDEWREAGIKPVQRDLILKAHKKYQSGQKE
ncbi:hypothetical protein F5877DRAFT_81632 [Lentinula edodes]|nr:hypothetical protein F5877DRAFT_81632 [Lentinula edodes]